MMFVLSLVLAIFQPNAFAMDSCVIDPEKPGNYEINSEKDSVYYRSNDPEIASYSFRLDSSGTTESELDGAEFGLILRNGFEFLTKSRSAATDRKLLRFRVWSAKHPELLGHRLVRYEFSSGDRKFFAHFFFTTALQGLVGCADREKFPKIDQLSPLFFETARLRAVEILRMAKSREEDPHSSLATFCNSAIGELTRAKMYLAYSTHPFFVRSNEPNRIWIGFWSEAKDLSLSRFLRSMAFDPLESTAQMLIHESAHLLGYYSEPGAVQWENRIMVAGTGSVALFTGYLMQYGSELLPHRLRNP